MIVVDTSVLVNLFRGLKSPGVARLRAMVEADEPFAIPELCCLELLQGARDQKEWKVLLAYLESQEILSARNPWEVHVEAARIFFDCRRAGKTVRSTLDCLIAAVTLEQDGVLLHEDRDYEVIARVRPLRQLGA